LGARFPFPSFLFLFGAGVGVIPPGWPAVFESFCPPNSLDGVAFHFYLRDHRPLTNIRHSCLFFAGRPGLVLPCSLLQSFFFAFGCQRDPDFWIPWSPSAEPVLWWVFFLFWFFFSFFFFFFYYCGGFFFFFFFFVFFVFFVFLWLGFFLPSADV